MTEPQPRNPDRRGAMARDAIMGGILLIWMLYAVAAVIQLFTSGAKVLESLPPYWFWGIPIAPYTALYQPWTRHHNGSSNTGPPAPPAVPEAPGAPA